MAKILVFDDEPEWLEFSQSALCQAGHDVLVSSGEAGVKEELARGPVDLVVLDILMPVNGRVILGYLKRFMPSLPVVVHSAHGINRHDPDFLSADRFVVKSPDPSALVRAVDGVLAERRRKHEL